MRTWSVRFWTAAALAALCAASAPARDAVAPSTNPAPAELQRRLDELEKSVQVLQERLGKQAGIPTPATSVEKRLDDIERKLAALERAVDQSERKAAELERRIRRAEANK